MTVVNYFELRWVDGYGHVSTAPNDVVVALEELTAVITGSSDHATLAVRPVRLAEGSAAVGVLRLDVTVPSSPRKLQYVHAIVMPAEFRRMTTETLRRIVARRYGDDVEGRIREVYEQVAVMTKEQGGALLAPLEITLDDVTAEARPAPPEAPVIVPPKTEGSRVDDDRGQAGGRVAARPPLWIAAVVAAAVAVVAIVYCGRQPSHGDGVDPHALDAAQRRVSELETQLATAGSQRDAIQAELDRKNNALSTCSQGCEEIRVDLGTMRSKVGRLEEAVTKAASDQAAAVGKVTRDKDQEKEALRLFLQGQLAALKATADGDHRDMQAKIDAANGKVNSLRHDLRQACGKIGAHRPDFCDGEPP